MIEQGIYFALGCIVTALLSLLFAPVFWRRALRLTRRRLQLQVPMSMQEILVERDQLRAQFAVERLRIEQAMERVQDGKAADMAEIGRQTTAAAALAEEVAALRQLEAAQQKEIELLHLKSSEHNVSAGALNHALRESEAKIEGWREKSEAARVEQERLRDELESHRTTIASLKTRGMGLEMRLTDAERAKAASEKQMEETLRGRLETAMGHAARHETAGISLRRELDDAKAHIRTLEADLAGKTSDMPRASSPLAAATKAPGQPDDESLRESIRALGVAVADLMRQRQDGGNDKPARHLAAQEPARVS